MTLPVLAELPAILLPLVTRSEQSFRTAVAELEDDHGFASWTPERWAQFARVTAASEFVIEQSVRDPLMLLALVQSGELDRAFAPGELCAQIAAAVNAAQTEDELVAPCVVSAPAIKCGSSGVISPVRPIWCRPAATSRTWPTPPSTKPINGCTAAIANNSVRRPDAAAVSRSKWSSSAWASSALSS